MLYLLHENRLNSAPKFADSSSYFSFYDVEFIFSTNFNDRIPFLSIKGKIK